MIISHGLRSPAQFFLYSLGLYIFGKFNISENFPEIFGNISKSLEVITSLLFVQIGWYSSEPC